MCPERVPGLGMWDCPSQWKETSVEAPDYPCFLPHSSTLFDMDPYILS